MNKSVKGYILLVTILSIGAIFFFALMLVRLQMTEKTIAQRGEQEIIAEQAAKAGIDQAFYILKQTPDWAVGFSDAVLPNSQATYSISFNRNQTVIPFSVNNSQGTATVTGYNNRQVPAGFIHVVSVGKYGDGSRIEEAILSASGGVLFEDDFQGNSGLWTRTMGNFFNFGSNRYNIGNQNSNSGEHRTFAGDTSWTDYTIETRANLLKGEGYGIYFRTTNEPNINSYIFQYDPGYEASNQGTFLFRRVINGGEQSPFARVNRKNTRFAGDSSWWYNKERDIKITINGNIFTAYVDGVMVVQGSDSNLKNGRIGYRIWGNSAAYFDDIKVSKGASSAGPGIISRW